MKQPGRMRPSPSMVVAALALVVALGGTAYAAQRINGGAIQKGTIGGGKLKHNTLTGFQIKVNKIGTVPKARRAAHTYWAVIKNPNGAGNAALARTSDPGIGVAEGGGAVNVIFPQAIATCADVAARNNAGTTVPGAGTAQTNTSPANPDAIEVHTRDAKGDNTDADFHLIVVCP